jgi:hypothetical protein
MTSSPDNTVIDILCDNKLDKTMFDEAKQSLDSHYLSIFLEVVGEAEEAHLYGSNEQAIMDEGDDFENDLAIARNALRTELRTALQDRLGEE